MSARVNLTQFNTRIKQIINTYKGDQLVRQAAEFAKDRIVKRTQLGYGVDEQGEPEPLKPLSKGYKDQRAGKIAFATAPDGHVYPYQPKRKPVLSGFTTAGKSNLTFTAQMLRSVKVTFVGGAKALIAPTGTRRNNVLTNREAAAFVSEVRPWLKISNPELRGLRDFISDQLRRIVRGG